MELTWTKRGEHGWEAWFGSVPKVGAVQVNLFEFGPACGNAWSSSGGLENEARTLCASFESYMVDTRAEAEARALRNGLRLQFWANGQGPESIAPLEWKEVPGEGLIAFCGSVETSLQQLGETWHLSLDARCGEAESDGYLRATISSEDDPMCLGWFEFSTEAEAKAWAQEKSAALCRWLGGNPDHVDDPAKESLVFD